MAKNVRNTDKNLIFAEYFNSEQEVRRNQSVEVLHPLTIENGEWLGNDLTQHVNIYKTIPAGSDVSFRFRCKIAEIPVSSEYFLDWRIDGGNAAYMLFDNLQRVVSTGLTTPLTVYINGEVNYDWSNYIGEWMDVIIYGELAVDIAKASLGRYSGTAGNNSHISFDFIEIYNKILTAEEASNLYNDARYVVPQLNKDKQLGIEKTLPFTNADFTFLTPPWSIDDSTNVASYDSSQNGTISCTDQSDLKITGGRRYEYTFTISDCASTGGFRVTDAGGADIFDTYHSLGNGTYTFQKTAALSASSKAVGMRAYVGAAFSISNFSVKEIKVESTKEILNVNAFSGVARNVLSGDVGNVLYNSDFSSSTDGWNVVNWGIGGAGNFGYSNNELTFETTSIATGSGDLRPNITKSIGMTSGKIYRLTVIGTGMLGGYYDGAAFINIPDVDLNNGPYIVEFVAGGSTPILYFNQLVYSTFEVSKIMLEEIIPEVTNTDVEVVKEGQIRVPRFNGSTSKIDCGDYHDLTGDITVMAWINFKGWGETNINTILDNGSFIFRSDQAGERLKIYSNGANPLYSASNSIKLNTCHLVTVIRTSNAVTNIYIDGILSGTADQNGISILAGSTNIIIGNNTSGTFTQDGITPEVRVIEGLLTAEEISSYYTATKHLYSK